jgi:hypothetical protein
MRNEGTLFDLEANGKLFALPPGSTWQAIDELVLSLFLSGDGNTAFAKESNGTVRSFSA